MMPTKTSQNAYKINSVGRFSKRNDFVPLLYQFCRQVKIHIISELQRIYYKTTKLTTSVQLFFPSSKFRNMSKPQK